jgi:hypothetical protein
MSSASIKIIFGGLSLGLDVATSGPLVQLVGTLSATGLKVRLSFGAPQTNNSIRLCHAIAPAKAIKMKMISNFFMLLPD